MSAIHWLQDNWYVIATAVITALGTTGITFRLFGERLLGHFFDRRLEAFKHERARDLEQFKHQQNQEIEELRGKVAHFSDRSQRSNEREFLATSALWEKVVDLYYATNMSVISYIEYPPLNTMPEEEVAEFLNTTEFSEPQKRLVLQAKDRERSFSHISGRRHINAAGDRVSEMNAMLHRQGIFVPNDLCMDFYSFRDMCINAIAQRRTEHGENFRTGLGHDIEFLQNGTKDLESMKATVRKRLLRE